MAPYLRIAFLASFSVICVALWRREWSLRMATRTFLAILALQSVIWCFWRVIWYPRYSSPLRHLPSPKGNSFFHGQYRKLSSEAKGLPVREWASSIPNEELIRYLGAFNTEHILVTSAEGLGEVLVKKSYDFEKPGYFRFILSRLLGQGLICAEGEEHKRQRRSLVPAFSFRHVKNLYLLFWSKSQQCVKVMEQEILERNSLQLRPLSALASADRKKAGVLEVDDWATRATLDIIGLASMGQDFRALEDPTNPLVRAYTMVFLPNKEERLLTLLAMFLPEWLAKALPTKHNKTVVSCRRTIRRTCQDLITNKKSRLQQERSHDVDILSVALASESFEEENLIDQLTTFLGAGHETTATALIWAVYMLCVNPSIQSRLREEIRKNLPPIDDSRLISALEIDNLPYLNAVCNETLRYWSPVSLSYREAVTDTSIQGQFIPKGTPVMMSAWATNKSPTLWGDDAHVFNPDRWLPHFEGDKKASGGHVSSNFGFLTFLHGPRSCIGKGFATAEFACLLAAWIGKFEFRLSDQRLTNEQNMEVEDGATARPANSLFVDATVIDGW